MTSSTARRKLRTCKKGVSENPTQPNKNPASQSKSCLHLPEKRRPICQRLTNPPIHELIQLVDPSNRSLFPTRTATIRATAIRPSIARPPDFGNDTARPVFALGRSSSLESNVVILPEIPRPAWRSRRRNTREEWVHVRQHDVAVRGEFVGPIVAQIGGCDGQVDGEVCEGLAHGGKVAGERGFGEVFAEEDFVADDDAGEVLGWVCAEEGFHLGELAGVGGGVVAEPDAEPDLQGVVVA